MQRKYGGKQYEENKRKCQILILGKPFQNTACDHLYVICFQDSGCQGKQNMEKDMMWNMESVLTKLRNT